MLDIRANDEHFAVSFNPETIRSAGMVVSLRGNNGWHIAERGEVAAGISNLQELEIMKVSPSLRECWTLLAEQLLFRRRQFF